jgi:hypothetical protein
MEYGIKIKSSHKKQKRYWVILSNIQTTILPTASEIIGMPKRGRKLKQLQFYKSVFQNKEKRTLVNF